jgi:hypothetical protein
MARRIERRLRVRLSTPRYSRPPLRLIWSMARFKLFDCVHTGRAVNSSPAISRDFPHTRQRARALISKSSGGLRSGRIVSGSAYRGSAWRPACSARRTRWRFLCRHLNADFQVIPMAWVLAAEARSKPSEGNAAAVSRHNARKWERKERQRWIV